jgi:hypothetical protein
LRDLPLLSLVSLFSISFISLYRVSSLICLVLSLASPRSPCLPTNRHIEVHKYLRTCYPTYFRVAILLQSFPCLNFDSFLSFHAHKVYMYRSHQQKSILINFGPSQLFFALILLHHILGKVLDIGIY